MTTAHLAAIRKKLEGALCEAQPSDYGHWQAELELQIKASGGKSRLARCKHNGPLYVQKPFYPEGDDLAHIYLLHPPGGIVSGDHLKIGINVEPGAKALVTTPGAARIYRAREDRKLQQQSLSFKVEEDASLEWFPLETIVYNDANVLLKTDIHLAANAKLLAWEVTCFGLPASGEKFQQGSFEQSYRIFREGRPVFIDRLHLNEKNRDELLQSKACMQEKPVTGFFIISDVVKDESLLEVLRERIAELKLNDVLALTHAGECFIARYLGASAEQARKAFTDIWHFFREQVLARPASEPRIWLT
jgi:urease accessory protein